MSDATERDEPNDIAADWERLMRTVPVVRGRRKVKVERADGTIDERDAADVVAALVERQGLEVAVREGALPIEIQRRRAAGLPDLCATCGEALAMTDFSMAKRRPRPPSQWFCHPCAIRRPHKVSEKNRAACARASGPADLCVDCNGALPMSFKAVYRRLSRSTTEWRCRQCAMRRTVKTMTADALSRRTRNGLMSLTPEQRRERARRAASCQTQTPEQRSEIVRKAWEKRKAKKEEVA